MIVIRFQTVWIFNMSDVFNSIDGSNKNFTMSWNKTNGVFIDLFESGDLVVKIKNRSTPITSLNFIVKLYNSEMQVKIMFSFFNIYDLNMLFY